jgi:ribonuclease Y
MPLLTTLLTFGLPAALVGAAAGYFYHQYQHSRRGSQAEQKINQKLAAAREQLTALRQKAEAEARELRANAERELDERRQKLVELETRIAAREEKLEAKISSLEQQQAELAAATTSYQDKEEQLTKLYTEEATRLTELSGLTAEQAEARVLKLAEERTKEDIVRKLRKLETEGERQYEEKARNLLSTIIQRYASSHVSEISTSHVNVPDDSIIGRIIGKEGRNIQHLERLTGCEIVIDETPNAIMVSGFSPLRRQVAKTAIERLIKDGRIHPGRIEEIVEEAKKDINKDIQEAGEAALYELGIVDFPDKLVHLIGRLKYRTSYRQNVLRHSVEAAHLATMLAQELGANVEIAKKATLLHDIGKAIDHEVEGDHVEIGEKIMRKFGISEVILRAAAAHHEDYPFDTREAIIVQVADAISAARPGARRENTEEYFKRMEDLENIATSYPGVAKAYAIHAGREVRVFVEPYNIDDLQAIKLAQQISKQIEQELTYPGEIKVNVIRETRADSLAR